MLSPPVLGIFVDRQDWVRSWNQAPELLQRIFSAQSFLVTFPIGLNVAWRNNWEMEMEMEKKHGGNIMYMEYSDSKGRAKNMEYIYIHNIYGEYIGISLKICALCHIQ
jgi:hypothetical protein